MRSKERQGLNKERERILADHKAVTAEMDAFVEENEHELNELLAQYWTLRKEAGKCYSDQLDLHIELSLTTRRGLYEHDVGQAWPRGLECSNIYIVYK